MNLLQICTKKYTHTHTHNKQNKMSQYTKKVHAIACGVNHSVALLYNKTVQCWGNDDHNQCDPLHKSFTDVVQVVCGSYHSVVLLSNNTIRC